MKIKNRINQNISSIVLELLLIIIAVFLGLIVNELRISYNEKEYTKKILNYMISEINYNSKQLESIVPYHNAMKDSLEKFNQMIFASTNTKHTFDDLFKAMPKGFSVPLIESTGWELLNNTGAINNIELELAAELSKVYNLQYFLQRKVDKIGENMYIASNINSKEVDNIILAFGFLVADILIQEKRLIQRYPNIIDRLKKAAT